MVREDTKRLLGDGCVELALQWVQEQAHRALSPQPLKDSKFLPENSQCCSFRTMESSVGLQDRIFQERSRRRGSWAPPPLRGRVLAEAECQLAQWCLWKPACLQ